MSFVGEATGVFGLLGKGWPLLRDRWDPTRAQAKRLIETFEVYGIARQQIPRILPPELKLPNAVFSRPDKLKDKVTPELLDWAVAYLVISRSWLDGVTDAMPHLVVVRLAQPSEIHTCSTHPPCPSNPPLGKSARSRCLSPTAAPMLAGSRWVR